MTHQPHLMHVQGRYGCSPELGVTCTCTAQAGKHGGRPRYQVIEARTRFPARDAIAAWRAWHEERGVMV